MAGEAGFEPTHADTKNRCLTAWLLPIPYIEWLLAILEAWVNPIIKYWRG